MDEDRKKEGDAPIQQRKVIEERMVPVHGKTFQITRPALLDMGEQSVYVLPHSPGEKPSYTLFTETNAGITIDNEVTLGRKPENTFSFPDDPSVSRFHTELTPSAHGLVITDKGSTNQTLVHELREIYPTQSVDLTHDQSAIFLLGETPIQMQLGASTVTIEHASDDTLRIDGKDIDLHEEEDPKKVKRYTIGSKTDEGTIDASPKPPVTIIKRGPVIEVTDIGEDQEVKLRLKPEASAIAPTPVDSAPPTPTRTEAEIRLEHLAAEIGQRVRQDGLGFLMAGFPPFPDPSILKQGETTQPFGDYYTGHDTGAMFYKGARLNASLDELQAMQNFLSGPTGETSQDWYTNTDSLGVRKHHRMTEERIVGYTTKKGLFGSKEIPQRGMVPVTFHDMLGGEDWNVMVLRSKGVYVQNGKEKQFMANFLLPANITPFVQQGVNENPLFARMVVENIWPGLIGPDIQKQIKLLGTSLRITDYRNDERNPEIVNLPYPSNA